MIEISCPVAVIWTMTGPTTLHSNPALSLHDTVQHLIAVVTRACRSASNLGLVMNKLAACGYQGTHATTAENVRLIMDKSMGIHHR